MNAMHALLTRVALLWIVLHRSSWVSGMCSEPKGIDFGSGSCGSESCVKAADFAGLPHGGLLDEVIGAVTTPKPGLSAIETPVVNHWTAANIGQVYSSMAAYEERALELWGRRTVSKRRRRCNTNQTEFDLHRSVTLAYTCLYVFSSVEVWKDPVGGAEVPLRELASTWGIDYDLCDLDRSRAHDKVTTCNDKMTPWGLAIELLNEINKWFTRDGFNRDGGLGRVKRNRVPYSDWRSKSLRYAPVNSAFELQDDTRWQPLLEHDGVGFLYHQDHVTPHIGETAVSIFLSDQEICNRTASLEDPDYDLDHEADLVLRRTKFLDDKQKARVEMFDDKVNSLSPLAAQFLARSGLESDSMDSIIAQVANIHAIREATIIVWRAKVEFDLIRPTTYIQNTKPDKVVKSYGGPDVGGPALIRRDEWQPYKRVMPHAEFPSGSSCLCEAYAEALIATTGVDVFPTPGFIELIRAANSSLVEKNRPLEDITFSFDSWTDISLQCGQSRLDGGMHFTASVPSGRTLCKGVGTQVASAIKALARGARPRHLASFSSGPPKEVRCPRRLEKGCCSLNFLECIDWCGSTELECHGCTDEFWLPKGPQGNCLGRWDECTDDIDGCCEGLECIGSSDYRECLPPTHT